MREDDIKEAMISRWKNGDEIPGEEPLKIEPEAHYSYFGKRGVADLFVLRGYPDGDVKHVHGATYEIKTRLEEPHHIMRQFNRMVYAFFEDENRKQPLSANFELTVAPTQHNLEHLIEYQHIYSSIWHEREQHHKPEDSQNYEKYLYLNLRHPNDLDPVPWQEMWRKIKKGEDLKTYLLNKNPKIAEELELG